MKVLAALLLTALILIVPVYGQGEGSCKDPKVEQRLLRDDVRFASPFYVIALPRNSRTTEMDNVCYTYFENGDGTFFHMMSITFKNGSNTYFSYSKGDISDRMGVAVATELTNSECIYHDYTLTPICNVSVFILYRCFIQGGCNNNIDIGITSGVDVRVVLAATPNISPNCRQETEASLKDTSVLDGGDYVLLPQKLKPQCITKYNNMDSIGNKRAIGSKEVTTLIERFGDDEGVVTTPTAVKPALGASPPQPTSTKGSWIDQNSLLRNPLPPPSAFNPYGSQTGSGNVYSSHTKNSASGYSSLSSYASSFSSGKPGQMPSSVPVWPQNSGQWSSASSSWNGQTIQPGMETHYHVWQPPVGTKTTVGKNSNIIYHVHTWDTPPPGCCRCN